MDNDNDVSCDNAFREISFVILDIRISDFTCLLPLHNVSLKTGMSKCIVQATAAFGGDVCQNQLQLVPGDLVELANEASVNLNNGWGYGKHLQSSRVGWFPTSYVRPYQQPQTAAPVVRATPVREEDYNPFAPSSRVQATAVSTLPYNTNSTITCNDKRDDFGFDGPILGGAARVAATASAGGFGGPVSNVPSMSVHVTARAASPPMLPNSPSQRRPGLRGRLNQLGSGISSSAKSVGSGISNGAKSVGATVSTGAKKAGAAVSTGAQKTGAAVSSGSQKMGTRMKQSSFFTPDQTVSASTTTHSGSGGCHGGRVGTSVTTTTHTGRSRGEKVSGSVGTYATFGAARSLAFGNVGGAMRYGAVAAGAFAVEGKAREDRLETQQQQLQQHQQQHNRK